MFFSLISSFRLGTISRFSINQTSKTQNPADSLSICTRVDQREQRRSRVTICIRYILTSNHNIQPLSTFRDLQWHQIMLVLLYQIWYRKWNGLIMILPRAYMSDFHQTAQTPFFWTTELWLLSGALWFLGETRIEVVDLAVIQRKCAKCYQNWINKRQLRLMKGIEQEKGSFQVTHQWNFKLYAMCWLWVPILHVMLWYCLYYIDIDYFVLGIIALLFCPGYAIYFIACVSIECINKCSSIK